MHGRGTSLDLCDQVNAGSLPGCPGSVPPPPCKPSPSKTCAPPGRPHPSRPPPRLSPFKPLPFRAVPLQVAPPPSRPPSSRPPLSKPSPLKPPPSMSSSSKAAPPPKQSSSPCRRPTQPTPHAADPPRSRPPKPYHASRSPPSPRASPSSGDAATQSSSAEKGARECSCAKSFPLAPSLAHLPCPRARSSRRLGGGGLLQTWARSSRRGCAKNVAYGTVLYCKTRHSTSEFNVIHHESICPRQWHMNPATMPGGPASGRSRQGRGALGGGGCSGDT